MLRRQVILLVLACLAVVWLVSPAGGERGPNVSQLRQAVQKNPKDPEANYKLGLKYMEMGRPRQAEKYLKEAIRLKPDYAEAVDALAKLNSAQGNYAPAVKDLQKLMQLQPDSKNELQDRTSNDYNKQGLALLDNNKFADAEAAFQAAAKAAPKASGPLNNLGVAYFQAGRSEEAAAAFRDAIGRDPNNPEAHFNLGLVLLASGDRVGAYAESLTLWRLNPDLAGQLNGLSRPPRTPYPYAPSAQ